MIEPVLLGPPRVSGLPLILDVIREHQPTHIYAAFSGGNDSITALDISLHVPNLTGAFFIDTGINLPGVEARARGICQERGVPMLVYRALENTLADGTPDPQDYDRIVVQHGFPGAARHNRMFDRLKGRAFSRLVRDLRERENAGRVLLISGTRIAESRRRARTVRPWQRDGNTVWVAPMWNWSTERRDRYMQERHLPRNPFSEQVGVSGDCLCGAYSKPGELERIEQHYPCVAQRLRRLQEDVKAAGYPWGWEENPPTWWGKERMPELLGDSATAYSFTCLACETRATASP